MSDTLVIIPIKTETVRADHAVSPQDQRKIQLPLALRLRELDEMPGD